MKKLLLTGLLLGSVLVAKAQGGIPVWPLVTAEFDRFDPVTITNTPHQYITWGGPTLNIMTDPAAVSRDYGQTQAAFNDCGELMFFAMHNGTNNPDGLELFREDGTPITFEMPGAIPSTPINANRGDDEIQIVKRPGVANQWYLIYSLDPPSLGDDRYQTSFLAYSLIEVPGGSTVATYVGGQKDVVLNAPPVGGTVPTTPFTYIHGKAVSRTSVTATVGHDLYAHRRAQGVNNFSVDRFEVTNAGIVWSANSGTINGDWWNLMVAGSHIELDPTESRLAVMERDQAENHQNVYIFNVTGGILDNTAANLETIAFHDLLIFPDVANSGTTGYTPTVGVPATYTDADGFGAPNAATYLSYLDRMERKIASIEFSPSGQYLYFTAGGYVQSAYGNLTFLGQIDLDNPTVTNDYVVRLQVQRCNGWDIGTYGRQDLLPGTTGLPWTALTANSAAGDSARARYDELQHISKIQSCIDGNLYFTKVNADELYVIPNPDAPMPVNLVPNDVDLSTILEPNVSTVGYVINMPDQIDGFDYSNTDYQNAQFVVNALDCEGECHLTTFYVIDQFNDTAAVFTTDQCPDTFNLCLHNDWTYDLVAPGVSYPNAFGVNAAVNYPPGEVWFDILDPGLFGNCCPAQDDTLFTTMTSDVSVDTYWTGKVYIPDNTVIQVNSGAVLDLTNVDIVFGECSGIDFVEGAYARINNSVLRPCNLNDTWRGLRFVGSSVNMNDNIINESTFKNAEVALNFENATDGVISNNLFSNCNHGIRVTSNQNFNHPISGNRFVTDDFYPVYGNCYQFTSIDATYGIRTMVANMTGEISHNEFIYAKNGEVISSYGVHQERSGAFISENTFTNYRNPIVEVASVYAVDIDNNEIEYNSVYTADYVSGVPSAAISLFDGNSATTRIFNNELNNHEAGGAGFGIYANNSTRIIASTNAIEGFSTGIQLNRCASIEVTSNTITRARRTGIYYYDSNRQTNDYITCNDITMRDFSGTGIYVYASGRQTNITSNCVKDSRNSIIVSAGATNIGIPYIRNNYLYNYTGYGVYNVAHIGNIGTSTDPGINTFWSNLNSAIDIGSTVTLNVADNFAVSNISGSVLVSLSSPDPYHSTASCGHQIYEFPSDGDLNTDLTCNNEANIEQAMFKNGDMGVLTDDYRTAIENYGSQFEALTILTSAYTLMSEDLLNELINQFDLTSNEAAKLRVQYFNQVQDYARASMYLNEFDPETEMEADYKTVQAIQFELLLMATLPNEAQVQSLSKIAGKQSSYSNQAIALLKHSTSDVQYHYEPAIEVDFINQPVLKVTQDEINISVHPNPSNGMFYIDVLSGKFVDFEAIKLYDIRGKLIVDYSVDFLSGQIKMDLSNLENGVYFVVLTDANQVHQSAKLVKN